MLLWAATPLALVISMSGNSTCSPIEVAGAIEAFAHSVSSVYLSLMVSTILGTLLLPFLFSLFYFSNSRQRRTPMFFCVVLSVMAALVQFAHEIAFEFQILYSPTDIDSILTWALAARVSVFNELPNFLADVALFCRLLAVYPPGSLSTLRRSVVLGVAGVIKALRITSIAIIVFVYDRHATITFYSSGERAWAVLTRVFALLDNGYATAFFLWKIYPTFSSKLNHSQGSSASRDAPTSRIHTLFWLAVSSFALPVPLYVVQIVLAALPSLNANPYIIFQYFSSFFSVICVAFATIWASSTPFRESLKTARTQDAGGTTLRFKAPTDLSSSARTDRAQADEMLNGQKLTLSFLPSSSTFELRSPAFNAENHVGSGTTPITHGSAGDYVSSARAR